MAKAALKDTQEININLLPGAEPSGMLGTGIHWTLTIGRYLIILTEIVAISIFVLNVKLSTDKTGLKDDIQNLSGRVSSEASFEKEFRSTQQRIDEVKQEKDTQFSKSAVAAEFLKLLPEGMQIDSLEVKADEVAFSGSFSSPNQLQTLVSSFSSSKKILGLDIAELYSPSEKNPLYTFKAKAAVVEANF
jgi:Tfp pilus assembly protein PilN